MSEVTSWHRLGALFDQAIGYEGTERVAFVEGACAGDPELRRALVTLLEADATADGFMDEAIIPRRGETLGEPSPEAETAGDSADQPSVVPDAIRVGQRLGPYRVLRPLGHGGMSAVYLAVRDDDTFQRRVVVKLVRADLQDADLERRLRTERHILASLDHPNIARLFDGGTTADGRPFFAMEYVEGVPITDYADQHELSVDERLTLFRKVLGAVQYAHQNLIIHRDLKPSNILVDAAGEPKLLDFGIAKLLNPDLAATDAHATATWLRLMTPHYASPEQVRGKLVGMPSDVYSLGVLLYELLAGRLPFDLGNATPGEIERILTERDPPRPSAAVLGPAQGKDETEVARQRALGPRELGRTLTGDLDAIVMKALRSAPQRRYATAERFADDVRRFQQCLPVGAREGSLRYRFGKLLRRHRMAAAVAASLMLALGVGSAGMLAKQAEVLRGREVAERERNQREAVLALVLDILQVADPNVSRGASFTVREALESSAPKLRQSLADQPALRAELLHTTGTIFHNLGLWSRSRVDLEEALSLRRALFGDDHPSIGETRSRLALVLANLGDVETARRMSTLATATARDAAGTLNVDALDLINNHVTVLCAAHDYQAAEAPSAEALALARRSTERPELVTALVNRAMVLLNHGEHLAAAELFQQGVDLLALQLGDDHPRLANPLSNLGSARRRAGDLDGAQAAFEKTLAIQQATLGEESPTLAITLNNLASIFAVRGEHTRATEAYRRAATIFARQSGSDHPRLLFLDIRIAQVQIDAGAPEAAIAALQKSLEQWRPILGEDHRFMTLAELALGQAWLAAGDLETAETMLRAAHARALERGWDREAAEGAEYLGALESAFHNNALGIPERAASLAASAVP